MSNLKFSNIYVIQQTKILALNYHMHEIKSPTYEVFHFG